MLTKILVHIRHNIFIEFFSKIVLQKIKIPKHTKDPEMHIGDWIKASTAQQNDFVF